MLQIFISCFYVCCIILYLNKILLILFLGVTEMESSLLTQGSPFYQCEMCSYTTYSTAHIKRHMLTHSGKRPYECSVCHKTFRQNEHLKIHFFTHTGERPFSCQNCGRSFLTKQNCQTHVCRPVKDKLYLKMP